MPQTTRIADQRQASTGRLGAVGELAKPARKRFVKRDRVECLAQGGQPKQSGAIRNAKCGMELGALRLANFKFLLIVLLFCFPHAVHAGDILRGGATAASGRKAADARANAGAQAAELARVKAADRLSRTTQAINAMRQMQSSARAASTGAPVPDGLVTGGLKVLTGANAKWTGALAPVASGNSVSIKQTQQQALLNWETFNVGKNTSLYFNQKAGGSDSGKWIAFNKVLDPSGVPSKILGSIKADGQVYVINHNGIIFGSGSQVNARTFVASALPINDGLVEKGLLNQEAGNAQFLFSADTAVPGTIYGDITVQQGARLQSPVTAEGGGGRIVLVGANVANAGTVSTPAGQTIFAAGLQVGFNAHAKSYPQIPDRATEAAADDPSLRGLDTYVGNVGSYAGTVINTGLVDLPTGSLTMVGKRVVQDGAVDSTTTVSLNGRIDLLAAYDAVPNANFNPLSSTTAPFLNRLSGTVTLGQGSVTRILPDLAGGLTTVGTRLPIKSQANIQGQSIFFDANSALQVTNGNIAIAAGTWGRILTNPVGGGQTRNADDFVLTGGQVYLESGALIDAGGSNDVFVPLAHSLLDVEFRGNELAVSPLQRTGKVRGASLLIDIRRSGTYQGRKWVGTPLGDATGFADVIQRNVLQLTADGGSVVIRSGQAVIAKQGSIVDVSGGYFVNEGGLIQTSRLRYGNYVLDIADATPDRIYNGLYDATTTQRSGKWGVSSTYLNPLNPMGGYTQGSYISGAAGGRIDIVSPGMALDGELLGETIVGPRQLRKTSGSSELPEPSTLRLAFTAQTEVLNNGAYQIYTHSPTPPRISFGGSSNPPAPAPYVELSTAPLEGLRLTKFSIPENFYSESGFGSLVIENSEGDFELAAGRDIFLPSDFSLSVTGSNIFLPGSLHAPGGRLSFTAYNLRRYQTAIDQVTSSAPPVVDANLGTIRLSTGSVLDVSGLLVDDRSDRGGDGQPRPFETGGGTIELIGYNVVLPQGSRLDASGGIGISAKGKYSYGKGGAITIKAGQDLQYKSILGGKLELGAELLGYSGKLGATLSIKAPLIQIGGSPLQGDTLLLQPDFFSQGGFSRFNLTGVGGASGTASTDPDAPTPYVPGVFIAPGTVIEPRVEEIVYAPTSSGVLQRVVRPIGLRSPVSLGLYAEDVRNNFVIPALGTEGDPGDVLLRRGDIVISEGVRIAVEPGGKVEIKGSTVNLLGSISAPGGEIAIRGADTFPLSASELAGVQFARSTVFIGPASRLSTAGTFVALDDPFGRKQGLLFDGGDLLVSGNIIASAGAVLDVSGVSALLDVHPSQLGLEAETRVSASSGIDGQPYALKTVPYTVDTDGGYLELAGSEMLFSDATLRGAAGGSSAVGGTLAVSSGRSYAAGANQYGSDINLIVTQNGVTIPVPVVGVGRPVRDASGAVVPALGYFAADAFKTGCFDSLDLGMAGGSAIYARGGNVEFSGPVSIQARGFLRLASGGIVLADSNVNLSAQYIAAGQVFREPVNPDDPEYYFFKKFEAGLSGKESVLPVSGTGTISFSAGLIDVGTLVFRNIGQATLKSGSDIRGNGELSIAGILNLSAAQIYPTTLADFNILAYDAGATPGTVNILRSGNASAPLSAGGTLSVYASIINQGGVLLAPFGEINLGWDNTDRDPATAAFDAPLDPVSGLPVPVSNTVTVNSPPY